MFDDEFYPTPVHVIAEMLIEENISGKVILEPSAGKGDIVDFLLDEGAGRVLAVERHPELRSILEKKCTVIGHDFLQMKSEQISHVQMIVMNPPFTQQDQHILHAWEIAPSGCRIVSLCNYSAYSNDRKSMRRTLRQLVSDHGSIDTLGMCFTVAERTTDIEIGLIKLLKPGGGYEQEFQGFFMFEEQEQAQASGLMPYNAVQDLVNRYVEAIKIFDRQLEIAQDLHQIMDGYFNLEITMTIDQQAHAGRRLTFAKELQKSGWTYIFNKLGLEKYSTKGLKEDVNKFVESQLRVPFTMRNIYRMLEIVIATTTQRMDKALLEVFDRLTQHHHENRFNVAGWKTNSHYLVSKKFILPYMCDQDQRIYKGETRIQVGYGENWEYIEDLAKALCYISGDNYEFFGTLSSWVIYRFKVITDKEVIFKDQIENYNGLAEKTEDLQSKGVSYKIIDHKPVYGEWFDWAYFRVKAFKKGSMHFEFKDLDLWGRFNQRIARLKGYPLFEQKEQTAYQDRMAGRGKRA